MQILVTVEELHAKGLWDEYCQQAKTAGYQIPDATDSSAKIALSHNQAVDLGLLSLPLKPEAFHEAWCHCRSCIDGRTLPIDQATPEHMADYVQGHIRNNSGVTLHQATVVSAGYYNYQDTDANDRARPINETWIVAGQLAPKVS